MAELDDSSVRVQETLLDLDVKQLISFVGGLKDAGDGVKTPSAADSIRRKTKMRRRPRRRRSPATSPCRSSLADKASDYEDIWGTSPPEEIPAPIYPLQNDDAPDEDSSSNSTLEKITSGGVASDSIVWPDVSATDPVPSQLAGEYTSILELIPVEWLSS